MVPARNAQRSSPGFPLEVIKSLKSLTFINSKDEFYTSFDPKDDEKTENSVEILAADGSADEYWENLAANVSSGETVESDSEDGKNLAAKEEGVKSDDEDGENLTAMKVVGDNFM